MENGWSVKTDKQVMSILSISVWSNLVCIALLLAINAANYLRGNFSADVAAEGSSTGLLSPEFLLLISAVCTVWLVIRIFATRKVIRRMNNVFLTIDGDAVSGISMADPSAPSLDYPDGRPFTVKAYAITDVICQEKSINKKQVAQSLIIKTADDTYTMPGLALPEETRGRLLRLRDQTLNAV